jgi:SMC interacting uncharacterized protein involved in chromosome segregation
MKKTKAMNITSTIGLVAALAFLAGCASSNYEKGAATSAGLKDSAERINAGKAKIDAALTSLNELVNNPQGDLVPKFNKYDQAVNDLESAAKNVSERVADMRENGNAYIKSWDEQLAQIKNEDIKSRSVQRKQEVMNKFLEIKKGYAEAQMNFKPFMAELKDIRTALSTDLTPNGVAAVKSTAEKANKDGEAVKASVDQLGAKFNELGVAMASSSGTTTPATTK